MPTSYPSSARPPAQRQTVYFAYGSNLSLAQMAHRCPESRYLGRGVLEDFKWRISSRGYANVYRMGLKSEVYCQDEERDEDEDEGHEGEEEEEEEEDEEKREEKKDYQEQKERRTFKGHDYEIGKCDWVEGLCFLLTARDEARLDVNEGVAIGAYNKKYVDILLYPASADLVGRGVREVMEVMNLQTAEARGPEENTALVISDQFVTARCEPETLNALVYVDPDTSWGEPSVEYAGRMRCGLRDALALGVSGRYVHVYIMEELHPCVITDR